MLQRFRTPVLIILFLSLGSHTIFGQGIENENPQQEIDTTLLKEVIADANVKPAQKITPLLQLAEVLGRTDIKKLSTYSREAYKLAIEAGDSAQRGIAARVLGVSYAIQGNYGEAAFLFSEAYHLANKFGAPSQELRALVNLAGIYFTQNDWTNSLFYARKALNTGINISDSATIAATHEAIGLVFLNTHTLDSAEFHFREAINLYKHLGKDPELANVMSSFSSVYLQTGQYQLALNQLRQAESIFQRVDGDKLSSQHISSMISRSEVNFQMQDYPGARKNLSRIIESSRQQGLLRYLSAAYRLNSRIDSAQQEFVSSLQWLNQYIEITDSIASNDKNSKLAATMAFYETKISDDEVDLLATKNELAETQLTNQREILAVVLLALFILSLLTAELIRRNRQVRLTNQRLANKQRVIQNKNQNLEEVGRQLMTQKSELETLNRTKDRWFGIISHDFRHPLAVLHGALDLIIEDDLSAEERRRVFLDIRKRLSRTSYLLDNLLFWAQHQMDGWKANYELIKIDELLTPVVDVVEGLAKEKNIELEYHGESKFQILTDPEAIRLVIRNLLSNSVKFSFPGQTIIIKVRDLEKEWIISVQDHGVGMTPKQIESIFGSDQRSTLGTHNEKGSGLGLSLCRDFVNFLGGSLEVVSEPGEQTTFTLHLPKGGNPENTYSSSASYPQEAYAK